MGFEPTISCLGSMRSTTELRPRKVIIPVQICMSRLAVGKLFGKIEQCLAGFSHGIGLP